MSEHADLLADVRTLRRRARSDRHAYWLPLLFFGLAVGASAPLYVLRVPAEAGPTDAYSLYALPTDPRLGTYWSVALLGGALLTVWWYRRRGSQVGIESRTGPALVAGTLFLMAYLVLGTIPGVPALLGPLWVRDFTALLVVAAGLLALAWQERSTGLGVTAAVFAATAIYANAFLVSSVAYRFGWDVPFELHLVPNLLLPAVVLLTGGVVAAVRAGRTR
jgi:hypothetical protein